jgi:hypothetical protein
MKSLNEKLADPLSTILSQNADLMEANLIIAQLTAENERLQRVVEQATKGMTIEGDSIVFANVRANWMRVIVGNKYEDPDLFAQLKGADRG